MSDMYGGFGHGKMLMLNLLQEIVPIDAMIKR